MTTLQDVIKHLQGKHPQSSHAPKSGATPPKGSSSDGGRASPTTAGKIGGTEDVIKFAKDNKLKLAYINITYPVSKMRSIMNDPNAGRVTLHDTKSRKTVGVARREQGSKDWNYEPRG